MQLCGIWCAQLGPFSSAMRVAMGCVNAMHSQTLNEYIKDTEDMVTIKLDQLRNALLTVREVAATAHPIYVWVPSCCPPAPAGCLHTSCLCNAVSIAIACR